MYWHTGNLDNTNYIYQDSCRGLHLTLSLPILMRGHVLIVLLLFLIFQSKETSFTYQEPQRLKVKFISQMLKVNSFLLWIVWRAVTAADSLWDPLHLWIQSGQDSPLNLEQQPLPAPTRPSGLPRPTWKQPAWPLTISCLLAKTWQMSSNISGYYW